MKRYALALLFLALAVTVPAFAQNHATNSDQCRADWRLWNYQDGHGGFSALGWREAVDRAQEMQNCAASDPSFGDEHYWNMSNEFLNEIGNRTQAFLVRHGEWAQFAQEDSEGKR